MIVLRAVQGFTGGVLIPMAFTLIITLLPKAKQPVGLALFALSATFAPAIGPTIGGYLTENWGWQYIFYVNLVPGAVMIAMLWFSLEAKPMKLSLLREGDWAGIATMAIGLSALQTVLEEGNKDDWFGSTFIVQPVGHCCGFADRVPVDRTDHRKARCSTCACFPAAISASASSPTSCWASRCTARSSSCRSIWPASRATMPSRSAWCWPGPDCRNWC